MVSDDPLRFLKTSTVEIYLATYTAQAQVLAISNTSWALEPPAILWLKTANGTET